MKRGLYCFVLFLLLAPVAARADVSLFVLESLGVAGEFTGSGHTAIYFSNICADGPTALRLCVPGEHGAVISSYPNFSENLDREWIAVPVFAFLYGVERADDIPLYANGKVRNFLRENFRQNHMQSAIPDTADGSMPAGAWQTMLSMAFNRDVYSFNIKTTAREDALFLQKFRERPVDGKFNAFSRNCADFSKKVINFYFPGATKRDLINDFGITTPKALARSFTRYASSRPERMFNVTKVSQVHGPIWRSNDNRNFTEKALVSKKYLVPSLFFYPPLFAGFAAAYLVTGRFSVHGTYKKYAGADIALLNLESSKSKNSEESESAKRASLREIAKQKEAERLGIMGDRRTWSLYNSYLRPILNTAIARGLFKDEKEIKTFFRDLELQSTPALDENGSPILKVKYYGEELILGLTRANILKPDSDRELAYKLMLAKLAADINSREKDRNSLEDFKADWGLLGRLRQELDTSPERLLAHQSRGRFLKSPPDLNIKRELQKAFIIITQ